IRQCRRTRRGTESEQTALTQGPLLRIVVSAGRLFRTTLPLGGSRCRRRPRRCEPLPRRLIVRRQAPVRWVADNGCADLSANHGKGCTLIEPKTVIAPDSTTSCLLQGLKERLRGTRVAANWWGRAIRCQRLVIRSPALKFSFLQGSCLFCRQE